MADLTLERDVQAEGMAILSSCGAFVLRTNQPRASRVSPGLPDVIALLPRGLGILLWEAKKSPRSKQSDSQILVERKCAEANVPYVCGNVEELRAWLTTAGILR